MSLAWEPKPVEEGPSPSSLEGARILAEKINAFWARRGAKVNAEPIEKPFCPEMREAYYVIRSDLVNGLPRRRAQ